MNNSAREDKRSGRGRHLRDRNTQMTEGARGGGGEASEIRKNASKRGIEVERMVEERAGGEARAWVNRRRVKAGEKQAAAVVSVLEWSRVSQCGGELCIPDGSPLVTS